MQKAEDGGGLMSIDQVAAQLGLHVRTVRRYVRHGRLRAVRIGKQYRVSREALDTLTGRATAPVPAGTARASATGPRHAEVSAIVHVDDVDAETAGRIMTALPAAAKGKPDAEDPLRVDTIYDPARARLKVILNGSVTTTASLLGMLNLYLEA
jgi:excisionase family DNA binding protein